jgi:predicted nucleic acid-binding protein
MDSSSIVKLFIEEPGSFETKLSLSLADDAATSLVTYPEVQAAFARLVRTGKITSGVQIRAITAFEAMWPHFLKWTVDEEISQSAGRLANAHPLKGFDAIHLASALVFRKNSPETVDMATWDRQLRSAAIAEGFTVVRSNS